MDNQLNQLKRSIIEAVSDPEAELNHLYPACWSPSGVFQMKDADIAMLDKTLSDNDSKLADEDTAAIVVQFTPSATHKGVMRALKSLRKVFQAMEE